MLETKKSERPVEFTEIGDIEDLQRLYEYWIPQKIVAEPLTSANCASACGSGCQCGGCSCSGG